MNQVNIGDLVKIVRMNGEPSYTNREGIVNRIDSIGQLHGTWGGLAINQEDDFLILRKGENNGKNN